jgi:hypothetical protein
LLETSQNLLNSTHTTNKMEESEHNNFETSSQSSNGIGILFSIPFIKKNQQSLLVALTTALLTLQALLLTSVAKRNALRTHKTSVSVAVTLMFEVTKLAMSIGGMSLDVGVAASLRAIASWQWVHVKLFAIPALAYLINDNLMFLLYSIIKVSESFVVFVSTIHPLAICFHNPHSHTPYKLGSSND